MLVPESSGFSTLIDYFTFASWVFYGATITGLLFMRFSKPHAERPFKVSKFFPVGKLISILRVPLRRHRRFPGKITRQYGFLHPPSIRVRIGKRSVNRQGKRNLISQKEPVVFHGIRLGTLLAEPHDFLVACAGIKL